MEARGGFSNTEKKMLLVSFDISQYAQLLAIVGKRDPHAFVIVHRAHEVSGEGWADLP